MDIVLPPRPLRLFYNRWNWPLHNSRGCLCWRDTLLILFLAPWSYGGELALARLFWNRPFTDILFSTARIEQDDRRRGGRESLIILLSND